MVLSLWILKKNKVKLILHEMKTLRYLSTTAFVVSLAMFASCSSDNDIETNNENNTNNGNTNSEKLVFSASIVPNEVTRATLNKDDKTYIGMLMIRLPFFLQLTVTNYNLISTMRMQVKLLPTLQARCQV